jgi:CRP-like cAMP-binding protein
MRLSPADVAWLFEKLRAVDFLDYHTDEELTALIQAMNRFVFPPGKTIIRQGKPGTDYYIIREGSVDVWADTPEGRLKLATLPAGEAFGEVSILTGEVCNATVTAHDAVEVFALPHTGLRQVVQANPILAAKMAEAVSRRQGVRGLGLEPDAAASWPLCERIKEFLGLAA